MKNIISRPWVFGTQSIPSIILIICLVMVNPGCKSQKKSTRQGSTKNEGSATESAALAQPANQSAIEPTRLAESNNRFALDLFRQIQGNSENLVYSPYSISTVMGMCYSGARGETAREMSEALYFPPQYTSLGQLTTSSHLDPAFKALNDQILSNDSLKGTEIKLANAIWAQEGFGFLPEYIESIQKWYEAPLTEMDFTGDENRENGRLKINEWVEDNTRQRIKDLISEGVLDASTRMVLTNAIYFNGKWMWPFEKNATKPSIFNTSSTKSTMTDFMNQTKTFPWYEDAEVKAIQLPYKNDRLYMCIILPKKLEGWEVISRVLDYERLNNMDSHFKPARVHVSLPKFSLELKLNLGKELSRMGMGQAFSMGADFSGMNGKTNLFIDEVIHKAFIELSENGTEAAAATAAVIGLKSALPEDPEQFIADHPFIYLIRDRQTGSIIFMGRFVNPL